jgi:hypothetical protein
LDDRETVYFELLKRNLETRRLIVLSTLGLVTAFGAIVIGDVLKGEDVLSYCAPHFLKKAIIFAVGTGIAWGIYYKAVRKVSDSIDELLRKLKVPHLPSGISGPPVSGVLYDGDFEIVERNLLSDGYKLPIYLSLVLTICIILPLEQPDPLKIMYAWVFIHPLPDDLCPQTLLAYTGATSKSSILSDLR